MLEGYEGLHTEELEQLAQKSQKQAREEAKEEEALGEAMGA